MRYSNSPTIWDIAASMSLVGFDNKMTMIISASEISVIEDLVKSGCDETVSRKSIERGIATNSRLWRDGDKLLFSYR